MKRIISGVIGALVMTAMIGITVLAFPVDALAAETTFSGTVSEKTTSDILYLVTSGGTMQIKIDGTTDLNSAKFLLPGYKVTCNCEVGSDEYWHASKITGNSTVGAAAVDTSKQYTVNGTISKGTNEEILYLKTSDGTMEIKIDTTTDVSGIRMFLMGKSVQVVCSRGSDAYMHAVSIRDAGSSSSTTTTTATTNTTTTVAPANNTQTTAVSSGYSVSGTVGKKTTTSVLYLSTSGGMMQLKIDSGATNGCRTLMPGQKVTANYYRGSDEWLHTNAIVNNTASLSATTTLNPNQLTVSGTVGAETSESTLYLITSGGTMQIRMDTATNFSGCPVMVKGTKLQVVCQCGADEYYHAVSVAYQ